MQSKGWLCPGAFSPGGGGRERLRPAQMPQHLYIRTQGHAQENAGERQLSLGMAINSGDMQGQAKEVLSI